MYLNYMVQIWCDNLYKNSQLTHTFSSGAGWWTTSLITANDYQPLNLFLLESNMRKVLRISWCSFCTINTSNISKESMHNFIIGKTVLVTFNDCIKVIWL